MLKVDFDEETIDLLATKVAERATEKISQHFQQANDWPPLLSKRDLENFLGIKHAKASELLNRPDFPVIREFGRPKVATHLLMKWIDDHTEWVKNNSDYLEVI